MPIINATEILLWKEISEEAEARATEFAEAGDVPASQRFIELHVLAERNLDAIVAERVTPSSDLD